jgi:hypothetical protein
MGHIADYRLDENGRSGAAMEPLVPDSYPQFLADLITTGSKPVESFGD